MDWRPNFAINRDGKRFESNKSWILKIDEKFKEVAKAYWFKEIIEIEAPKKKTLKSKK